MLARRAFQGFVPASFESHWSGIADPFDGLFIPDISTVSHAGPRRLRRGLGLCLRCPFFNPAELGINPGRCPPGTIMCWSVGDCRSEYRERSCSVSFAVAAGCYIRRAHLALLPFSVGSFVRGPFGLRRPPLTANCVQRGLKVSAECSKGSFVDGLRIDPPWPGQGLRYF